jgi:lipoic acid synthetase
MEPKAESANQKQRGAEKLARIPVKIVPTEAPLRKPDWIRIRFSRRR